MKTNPDKKCPTSGGFSACDVGPVIERLSLLGPLNLFVMPVEYRMSADITRPGFPPLTVDEMKPFRKLADSLKLTGVAQLACAAFLVALGLMGFETANKINSSLLLLAAILFFSGGGMLAAGRAFGHAVSGEGDKASLVEGIRRLASGHAIVAAFFLLAAIVFGARLISFAAQVIGNA